MSELPSGWAEAQLGDVATFVMGQAPPGSASNFDGNGTPFVKAGEFGPLRPIIREWTTQPLKMAAESDVLICVVGATSGKINLGADCAIGRSVAAIRPADGLNQFYLYSFMQTQVDRLRSGSTGTAQGVISSAMLSNVALPIAPVPEQQRIVAKVDGLTARTARARKELDRIPTLIARYKSAVLALAFSGKLTKDWRIERDGGALGAGEYPEGWTVRELEEISEIQGGIQVGKKRPASAQLVEVPYLRVANVQRGWLNLEEIKTLEVTAAERDRLLLADGDILMNEGGDRDKLGRGWVWRAQIPVCIHQNHVFRIRLNDPDFPPEYVSHYANENGQRYFIDQGTQTTNLASISKRKVAALPVPIPPTDEAAEIVRRIESAFGWLDRMAADHAAAARLLPKLDAAILAKAFQGKLVPQDPNDEPAAKLLERVKVEQEATPKAKRGRKSNLPPITGTAEITLGPVTVSATGAVGKAPTRARKDAMAKSRQDDDVKGKPYLAGLLKHGRYSDVQSLFRAAELPVADFYKQLAWEIDKGHILDSAEELKAA